LLETTLSNGFYAPVQEGVEGTLTNYFIRCFYFPHFLWWIWTWYSFFVTLFYFIFHCCGPTFSSIGLSCVLKRSIQNAIEDFVSQQSVKISENVYLSFNSVL
jgi:hypothetical protein